MSGPLVTAIVPTFDGAAFVADCLEGALGQTYDRIEVVVVDDCSTDDTPEIVADYARRFPERVRLVRFATRSGPCRRRNDALGHARGSLIAWLDQDDAWLPTKIERQVACFDDPAVAFAYSDWEDVDEQGRTLPRVWPHRLAEGEILRDLFAEGCFICSSTAVVRRSALMRRNLRFRDEDFSFGDDYFLWLALSLDWRAACVPEVLVRYRRHGRNESARRPEVDFHLRRIELLRELLATFPDAREKVGRTRRAGFARHYLRAARFEYGCGRQANAAWCGARAALASPATVVRALARELAPVPSA